MHLSLSAHVTRLEEGWDIKKLSQTSWTSMPFQ